MPYFVFLCILFLYSFIGIVWLQWNIFHIVYLYWCENMLYIGFQILEVWSVKDLKLIKEGESLVKKEAFNLLFTSLFVNIVYFIFIIVAIGFIYPVAVLDNAVAKKYIFHVLSIIMFKNSFFNIALLACLVYKIIAYFLLQYFKNTVKYTKKLIIQGVFSKQNIVLHLTILLGLGSILLLQHPDFGGKYGLGKTAWASYGIGIVMIMSRLGVEIYELRQYKT